MSQLDSFGLQSRRIRTSAVGDLANRYSDPSEHNSEINPYTTLANATPTGRFGLRGVVVPRATPFGGSRGFDSNKPTLVNIDPDIKEAACVIDLSKISKDAVEDAYRTAAENPEAVDQLTVASETFRRLAVSNEPVGINKRTNRYSSENVMLPPVDGMGTYIVPPATSGGRQLPRQAVNVPVPKEKGELISPSVAPRKQYVSKRLPDPEPNQTVKKSIKIEDDQFPVNVEELVINRPAFEDQTPTVNQKRNITISSDIKPPETVVIFENEGWGSIEACFHAIIKNDCLLILVYDNRYKGGTKFNPPVTDKTLKIRIPSLNKVFYVNSFGNKFTHNNNEYCLLVIDRSEE